MKVACTVWEYSDVIYNYLRAESTAYHTMKQMVQSVLKQEKQQRHIGIL